MDLAKPNKVEEENIFNQSLDTKALSICLIELPLNRVNFFPLTKVQLNNNH
jgi:hypothetical protein